MDLKNKLADRSVYIDTNIIIYLIEGFPDYQGLINDIQALLENDELNAYTSEMSLCESLIKPFKVGSTIGASLFRTFLEESDCIELFPIDRDILIQSAFVSADTGMKTPDAIHVATAMSKGCELFLTNDKNIKTPKNLEKVILSDYLYPSS